MSYHLLYVISLSLYDQFTSFVPLPVCCGRHVLLVVLLYLLSAMPLHVTELFEFFIKSLVVESPRVLVCVWVLSLWFLQQELVVRVLVLVTSVPQPPTSSRRRARPARPGSSPRPGDHHLHYSALSLCVLQNFIIICFCSCNVCRTY